MVGLSTGETVDVVFEAPGFGDVELFETLQLETDEALRFGVQADFQMEGTNKALKGVLVSSDGNILVSVVQKSSDSCGSYMAMPLDALGYNYYVITHVIGSNSNDFNQIAVLATEDETTVKLIFPQDRGLEVFFDDEDIGDEELEVTLNRFEALQVQTRRGDDLSGTKVEASDKVAVYAGTFDGNEYVIEQMPPIHSFGKEFIIVDFPEARSPSIVKILAPFPNTNVQVTDYDVFISSDSETVQEYVLTRDYIKISSDQPILVSQYGDFDEPAAMIISPVEQFRNSYTFLVPESLDSGYTVYLIMVIRKDKVDSLLLNEGYISSSGWIDVIDTEPQIAGKMVTVDGGFYRLYNEDSDVQFGATLFGLETDQCTFALVAGMCLEDIRQVSGIFCLLILSI